MDHTCSFPKLSFALLALGLAGCPLPGDGPIDLGPLDDSLMGGEVSLELSSEPDAWPTDFLYTEQDERERLSVDWSASSGNGPYGGINLIRNPDLPWRLAVHRSEVDEDGDEDLLLRVDLPDYAGPGSYVEDDVVAVFHLWEADEYPATGDPVRGRRLAAEVVAGCEVTVDEDERGGSLICELVGLVFEGQRLAQDGRLEAGWLVLDQERVVYPPGEG